MKIKLKNKTNYIPSFDSYCGLDTEDWIKLNGGKTIEIKHIPEKLEDYVKEVKPKKEKEL